MSSITNIYTDPFILGLQQFPMPELPEDAVVSYGYAKGMPSPMLGQTHSEETKRLIGLGWLGRTHTEESKQKMRRPKSEEAKRNMRNHIRPAERMENHRQRMLKDNPMDNPESVEKVRKTALNKKPCPHCGMMGNAGTLARHIKARHS